MVIQYPPPTNYNYKKRNDVNKHIINEVNYLNINPLLITSYNANYKLVAYEELKINYNMLILSLFNESYKKNKNFVYVKNLILYQNTIINDISDYEVEYFYIKYNEDIADKVKPESNKIKYIYTVVFCIQYYTKESDYVYVVISK